tara:strand:+ start:286 stop:528 length:243 start_codon:yes stop_codon:yes gene_type:complete
MVEKITMEERIVDLTIEKAKEVLELLSEQQVPIDKEGNLEDVDYMKTVEEEVPVKRPKKNPPEEKLDVLEGIADEREFKA